MVQRILDESAIDQVRFSSIEPQDVIEDFVALVASSDRIAPHFHIPLQSGCDRILRAMHRWYRTGHYAERIHLIRRRLPDAAIGADVIVGFPGETDADFRATVDFIGSLSFTYLHVFSFPSVRERRPRTWAMPFPRKRFANAPGHFAISDRRESARFALRRPGTRSAR